MMNIYGKVEFDDRPGFLVEFLIQYCLDIDLSNDEASTTKDICIECVERLKFIFSFKEICWQNNEKYFGLKRITPAEALAEAPALDTSTVLDIEQNVIKEEPKFNPTVVEHNDSDLLVEMKSEPEDYSQDDFRLEENRKNAEYQKLRRADGTSKQREARRKKTSEQARLRRRRKREEYPEEYAKELARAAELKRRRRNGLHHLTCEDQKHYELSMKLETSHEPNLNVLQGSSEKQKTSERKWIPLNPNELATRRKIAAEKARLYRQRRKVEKPEEYARQLARAAELKRIRRKFLSQNFSDSSNGHHADSQSGSLDSNFQDIKETESRTLTPDELIKLNMKSYGSQLEEQERRNAKTLSSDDLIKLNMQAYESHCAKQNDDNQMSLEELAKQNMEQFEKHLNLAQAAEVERLQRQSSYTERQQVTSNNFNQYLPPNVKNDPLALNEGSSFSSWPSENPYNET